MNIGSSVLKREAKSMDKVTDQLKRNGWSKTGEIADHAEYYENSGMSITVIEGLTATLIIPSGPIRGRVFGNSGFQLDDTSVIGAGADSGTDEEIQNRKAERKVNQIT